jgi:polynucleotide 5'-kinase involved in rRNA processing
MQPCEPMWRNDWQHLADDLVRSAWRRVVVLGASDRGKSTFCRFLAQQLALADVGMSLLDADPGQKMLGPPACVTAGYFNTTSGKLWPFSRDCRCGLPWPGEWRNRQCFPGTV